MAGSVQSTSAEQYPLLQGQTQSRLTKQDWKFLSLPFSSILFCALSQAAYSFQIDENCDPSDDDSLSQGAGIGAIMLGVCSLYSCLHFMAKRAGSGESMRQKYLVCAVANAIVGVTVVIWDSILLAATPGCESGGS